MAAQIYRCNICQASMLAFEGEEERLTCKCSTGEWQKLPPMPVVIHASSRIEVDYYLDSILTLHDRDVLNRRAAVEERELKYYSQAVINE